MFAVRLGRKSVSDVKIFYCVRINLLKSNQIILQLFMFPFLSWLEQSLGFVCDGSIWQESHPSFYILNAGNFDKNMKTQ